MSKQQGAPSGCSSFLVLFLLTACLFRACSFIAHPVHNWQDATCTEPRTCAECGETDGEPLGHDYQGGDCCNESVCARCGASSGRLGDHVWAEPTCTEPKTCIICGKQPFFSVPNGHEWIAATCYAPKTCAVCGATEGEPVHCFDEPFTIVSEPTCQSEGIKQRVCALCGFVEEEAIPVVKHTPGDVQTVREATEASNGLKVCYCTVCGEPVYEREFSYTPPAGDHSDGSNFNTYNNEQQQETSASYVLNTATMVFHRPYCRDVPKIAPQNYSTSNQSRSSLIESGYRSCGHCNP